MSATARPLRHFTDIEFTSGPQAPLALTIWPVKVKGGERGLRITSVELVADLAQMAGSVDNRDRVSSDVSERCAFYMI